MTENLEITNTEIIFKRNPTLAIVTRSFLPLAITIEFGAVAAGNARHN